MPADRLPDPEEREASWQHIIALAATLSAEELLGLDNETILHRLYHEEELRLFAGTDLQFKCNCTRERSEQALISLGLADVQLLLEEKAGTIEIDCQFCNERYLFNESDVKQMFAEQDAGDASSTVHSLHKSGIIAGTFFVVAFKVKRYKIFGGLGSGRWGTHDASKNRCVY